MATIEEATKYITQRQFEKVEDIWTDLLIDKNITPEQYFSVVDALGAAGESERACLLLELLTEHYETQKEYANAIKTQKHMLRYRREDAQVRNKLIALYRQEHAHAQHYEEYLDFSGLNSGVPIMKAIQTLEEFLKFDVGQSFYFERYGLGEVVDVKPDKKEIIIDFEKKGRHFLKIDVARGLLTPVNKGHFLYEKAKHIADLKLLAVSQPAELVVMLLKSFREPVSASRIKNFLQGIIEQSQLDKFWEKTKKILEAHDHVRVAGKTVKTYTYVESATDKANQAIESFHAAKWPERYRLAQEYAGKMPQVFEMLIPHLVKSGNTVQADQPGAAMDILMLLQDSGVHAGLNYSIHDLLAAHKPEDILNTMIDHEHKNRLLALFEHEFPESWPDIAERIFFSSDDFRLLDSLVDHLHSASDRLTDIYRKVLAMPKQYPEKYLWLLKRIESGSLRDYLRPSLVPRFIDSLDYVSGVKTTIKNILSLANFDTVVARSDRDEAIRIRDSIRKNITLTDYEKGNLLKIVEHHFPDFVEKKIDIIYTTEAALKRKREELNHILTIEIPNNKKDISRAREFGDLSENFEYKAAKEKQDQLYERAKTIESELSRARIIDILPIMTDRVTIGTAVKLKNTEDESTMIYRIMGRWDTDLENRIISNEAPLAQVLMGKKCGDSVEIDGTKYDIIAITKAW